MSYKTILVHVDESTHVGARITVAGKIANVEGAHLVGVAMTGIERFLEQAVSVNPDNAAMAPYVDTLRKRAKSAVEKFNGMVERIGVLSHECRLVDDSATDGFCVQARYADLVIVGQNDPGEMLFSVGPDFAEFVVMHSHCPTLIIPYEREPETIGQKILIAWNGSLSAKRSVLGALPLLKNASSVVIVVFRPRLPQMNVDDEHQHGADLNLFLQRHGVKATVNEQICSHNGIGIDLLSLAEELHSDTIVMGCYGHSRFSEMVFGGVSRSVLQSMALPVLMCH